jgi:hypothetical protein
MRPGDCGRKDQILRPTRVVAQGTGFEPGHFTSRTGRSRMASGHDALLRVLRMARNAADAVDSARSKGGDFSASPAAKSPSLTGTNRTRRRRPPAESRYLILFPISSMLKECHEMFGLRVSLTARRRSLRLRGFERVQAAPSFWAPRR